MYDATMVWPTSLAYVCWHCTDSGALPGRVRFWQPEMGLPPSVKLTFPVGVPPPGPFTVTVAVYVMGTPSGPGLAELVTTVVVPAWFTTWEKVPNVVLPWKFPSPL